MPVVVKRFSLLRRRSSMDCERFLAHYEGVHGPLAAAQDGFRQFAYRYVQNHVLATHAAAGPPGAQAGIDGISVTYQKPRADYRRGFFQHPDYANVRADEEYLFDTAATVSLLGEECIVCRRGDDGEKAIFLVDCADDAIATDGEGAPSAVRKAVCNRLDADSASALGFGAAAAPWRALWEVWFASRADREQACRDRAGLGMLSPNLADEGTVALAVREVVFFTGHP
jgi:hypothetical protein